MFVYILMLSYSWIYLYISPYTCVIMLLLLAYNFFFNDCYLYFCSDQIFDCTFVLHFPLHV